MVPIFLLMIFGVAEYSLINASIGLYNFAAKDGARLGSLLGRSDPNVDSEIVAVIRAHVLGFGLVAARPQTIEIFRSNAQGDQTATTENVYDINGNVVGTNNWPVDIRDDTLSNADFLGVRIKYQYTYITALVAGPTPILNLAAVSIQRIEPADYQSRRFRPQGVAACVAGCAASDQAGVPALPTSAFVLPLAVVGLWFRRTLTSKGESAP